MGDIRKKIKSYKVLEIKEIEDLPAGLKFDIDGKTWDFNEFTFKDNRAEIAYWLSVYFWRNKSVISNKTRDVYIYSYRKLWEFFDDINLDIQSVSQIDTDLIIRFKSWLNSKSKVANEDALSQGTKRHIFSAVKNTLKGLVSYEQISEEVFIPEGNFRNTIANSNPTLPFTQLERMKIVNACKKEFEQIEAGEVTNFRQIYVPYLLTIALRTGINLQPLLDLKTNSIRESILEGRIEISLKKNRGYSSQTISFKNDDYETVYAQKTVASLFNKLISITDVIRNSASSDISSFIFLVHNQGKGSEKEVSKLEATETWVNIQRFRDKYSLTDDVGNPLVLNIRRMRPTFAHHLLKINGGDIRHLQKSLNHTNMSTTMGYLNANDSEFKSSFKFNGLVMQSSLTGKDASTLVKEINCTYEEAEKLIAGQNNMKVSTCKNPEKSPIFKSNTGDPCTHFTACFRCPNQIITKDDTHKVFSFYWWILSKKNKMPPNAWEKSYEWIVQLIDGEVSSALGSKEEVEEAKRHAKVSPHRAWVH